MIFKHIRNLKDEDKKIGITFSAFDMLHAGHIAMLAKAINSDANRVVQTCNIGGGRTEVS
jgi:bifunctional ADP-heptose synthase (sugar kinase/adenylyltransferase)